MDRMSRYTKLSSLIFSTTCLVTLSLNAAAFGDPAHSGSILSPDETTNPFSPSFVGNHVKHISHIVSGCDYCHVEAVEFNDLTDKLYLADVDVYRAGRSLHEIEQQVDADQASMKELKLSAHRTSGELNEVRHALKAHQNQAAQAKKTLNNLEEQSHEIYLEMLKARRVLALCELKHCKTLQPHYPLSFKVGSHAEAQLGLTMAAAILNRSGTIEEVEYKRNSGEQEDYELGLMANLYFGPIDLTRLLVFMNLYNIFGSSTNLITDFVTPGSGIKSSTKVGYGWGARAGVGVESKPLYGSVRVEGGVAVAALNQTITGVMGEGASPSVSKSETNLAPSVMVGASADLCKGCVGGKDIVVSARIYADKYSSMSISATAPVTGNAYRFSVDQRWNYTPQIGVAVKF